MSSAVLVALHSDVDFTATFSVRAQAEPGVMPRVMELFAKRGLVPLLWHGVAAGPLLHIEIRIAGLAGDTVDYIARCMGQITGVETVLTATE